MIGNLRSEGKYMVILGEVRSCPGHLPHAGQQLLTIYNVVLVVAVRLSDPLEPLTSILILNTTRYWSFRHTGQFMVQVSLWH